MTSLGGLVFLLPALILIGLAIFLISGKPIIFSQERVGRCGKPFIIKKFRTMVILPGAEKGSFEPGNNERTTTLGSFLRATKMDELPQLWNVLKGDMALVGPRPEVRKWVDAYPERWETILVIRPGITDPAALLYRDEESILHKSSDPEMTYREAILPHKLNIYKEYVENNTVFGDLLIILRTAREVVRGSKNR